MMPSLYRRIVSFRVTLSISSGTIGFDRVSAIRWEMSLMT